MSRIKRFIYARSDTVDGPDLDRGRKDVPWETDAARGALDLTRDGAQHRRYHSMFEDLLN